jgi:hypothetical protein
MTTQGGEIPAGNRKLHVVLAAAFVAIAAISIELLFGVHLADVLRFEAFEAAYVFLPGWLAYVALTGTDGGLARQLAIGAGLGFALECLAFAATGALGKPAWFAAYPAVVALVAVPLIWRRRTPGDRLFSLPSPPAPLTWAVALAFVATLIYLALINFLPNPLPHAVSSVTYYTDTVWDISNAAEAKYHWPITDPRLAGQPFYYYTFVFMHMAAASRLTGLPLPLIVLRLYIVSFFLVFALQLYVAGSVIGRGRLAGLFALLVTLFIGSIQVWPLRMIGPFLNGFYTDLSLSPTYILGLLILTPLVIETYLRLTAPGDRRAWGSWLVIILLLIAGGGAKGTVAPVYAGGLGIYFIIRLLAHRRFDRSAFTGAAVALVIFVVWNKLAYSHAGIPMVVNPLRSISMMPFLRKFVHFKPDGATIPALSGLAHIPLLGRHLHIRKNTHFRSGWILLVVTPFAVAAMLGIRALTTAWLLTGPSSRRTPGQLLLLSMFLVSLVPFLLLDEGGFGQAYFLYDGFALLSVSAGCALAAMADEAAAHPSLRKRILWALAALLLLNGIFDTPINHYGQIRDAIAPPDSAKPGAIADAPGLTAGLLAGLDWLRLHSSPSDVLAVNNQFLDRKKTLPRDYYYSAFSERRVFLEGWAYSNQRSDGGRAAVNQAVFDNADPAALRTLVQQYGVRWLVVDKTHASANPLLSKLATPVFSNPDIDIYSVGSF